MRGLSAKTYFAGRRPLLPFVVVSGGLMLISLFLHGAVGLIVFGVGALLGIGAYVYLRRALRQSRQ